MTAQLCKITSAICRFVSKGASRGLEGNHEADEITTIYLFLFGDGPEAVE